MIDETVRRLLRQALQVEGSTQALAHRFRAPEATLMRWLEGRAAPPLRLIPSLLDFLMQAGDAKPDPEPAPPSESLVFRMGQLTARCERCDGSEFRLAHPGALRMTSPLLCTSCGRQVIHGNLLAALANDAVQHARAATARRMRSRRGCRL